MHSPTAIRIAGALALAVSLTLPWPDGALLAGAGGRLPAGLFSDFAALSPLLALAALLLVLAVIPRPAVRPALCQPLPVASPVARRHQAGHLLGAVVDHVSAHRLRVETGLTDAPRPVPGPAQPLLQLVSEPGTTLRRAAPDLGRQTRALLDQLRG